MRSLRGVERLTVMLEESLVGALVANVDWSVWEMLAVMKEEIQKTEAGNWKYRVQ